MGGIQKDFRGMNSFLDRLFQVCTEMMAAIPGRTKRRRNR